MKFLLIAFALIASSSVTVHANNDGAPIWQETLDDFAFQNFEDPSESYGFSDAHGISYFGTFQLKGYTLPSGQLYGAVEGNGLFVDIAGGHFIAAGNICNWFFKVDFEDLNGHTYDSRRGNLNGNCTRKGLQKLGISGTFKPGKVCIRLVTAGHHVVSSVCHNLH